MRVLASGFRTSKKRLKKHYLVTIIKSGFDLLLPIPDEIVKAFGIEVGDVAVWEVINKKCFMITFVKKTMFSFVESYEVKNRKV